MIQSDELAPSEAAMLTGLGLSVDYLASLEGYNYTLIDIKKHYLLKVGMKKFLNDRRLLDDQLRNEDAVIYLTDSIEFGYGTCSTIFIIY